MYRRHTFLSGLWRHLVLLLFVAFALFPLLWVLSASFNPANTLVGQKLIPTSPSLDNYRELFTSKQHPVALWIRNSVVISIITSALVVSMTALAAYAFFAVSFQGAPDRLVLLAAGAGFPTDAGCGSNLPLGTEHW